MRSLAARVEEHGVSEEIGAIARAEDGGFVVRSEAGRAELFARRAVSCLVEPEAGDRVLVAGAGREWWVLAVLAREPGAPARVVLDGDLALQLKGGRFTVAAAEGMELAAGRSIAMATPRLDVTATEGNVTLGRLSYLGTLVHGEIERLKLYAESVDTFAGRVFQRVKRAFRVVEELEQLKAGQIDYVAKENLRMHSHNTIVSATGLVKMDAEQVHLG